uniref:THAP domain containing 7 n=1 Tax=Astyanax mexicanus TaxID=7994 RepID=A0A3B1K0X1_ASTMX
MPRHCSAAGCNSRDTREARKSGLTFHRLPKRGNPRRATWILNSCRKGPEGKGQWDPQSDYIYFCSKHFTPDSFELSGVSGYRRLKDDAVPTLIEAPAYQRGKSSKAKGRAHHVEKQKRASSGKGKLKSKDTSVSDAFVQNATAVDEAEHSSTINGENGNEQRTSLLFQDVQTNKISSQGQPTDEPTPEQTSPRPPSPSCYMRRLPPPPGFYLAKEHNYAQLCPLVWRKRYDKAIDNLEKALRLLSAARRRENRLRLTLLRLREHRLKSTLSRTPDSGQRKEGRGRPRLSAPLSGKTARADLSGLEENEIEGAPEDMDIFTEEGWRRPTPTTKERAPVEEEEGCCFYCGRGREDEESKEVRDRRQCLRATETQVSHGSSKLRRIQRGKSGKTFGMFSDQIVESTKSNASVAEPKDCYLFYCETDSRNEDQSKSLSTDLPPQQEKVDREASVELCGKQLQQVTLLHPQTEMLLQMHTLPGPTQPTITVQEATSSTPQLPQVHLLQPSLGLHTNLLLPDVAMREGNVTQNEPEWGNQIYWVQERTDRHLVLVPVPARKSEKSGVSVDSGLQNTDTQSILVTEESFQQRVSEEGYNEAEGFRNSALRNCPNSHPSNVRATVVSGDVRQRLKEHLEGFHLQLTNEFTD